MSTALESLWSPDIKPTISSPFVILMQQADALTRQTDGLLVGEGRVRNEEEKSNEIFTLDIVVPALGGYRQRILTASCRAGMVYPVWIDAELFRPKTLGEALGAATTVPNFFERKKLPNEAVSDQEFRELLERVLRSAEVTSLATSLIARANDVLSKKQLKAKESAKADVDSQATSPPEEHGHGEATTQ